MKKGKGFEVSFPIGEALAEVRIHPLGAQRGRTIFLGGLLLG